MRMRVWSLASLSGLRNWRRCELWCSWQMRLRCHIAMAVVPAGSCSSDSTPSLGTSICSRCGPKKQIHEWINLSVLAPAIYQREMCVHWYRRCVRECLPGCGWNALMPWQDTVIAAYFYSDILQSREDLLADNVVQKKTDTHSKILYDFNDRGKLGVETRPGDVKRKTLGCWQ